ncbi:MAG: DUF47 family protein [Tissierellia bacterium]|nr:DUF47 family protein [Tissierellia bacterium]
MFEEIHFNYFQSFANLSKKAREAADLLSEVAADYDPSKLKDRTQEMHGLEQEADQITHSVIDALAQEYFPPLAREDIINLAHALDSIVDSIEDVLLCLYMYHVPQLIPEAMDFVELIFQATEEFSQLMVEFVNHRKKNDLREKVIRINFLEGKGDDLYIATIRKLFGYSHQEDLRYVLVWKEVIDALETALDALESVANEVETVLLKNE